MGGQTVRATLEVDGRDAPDDAVARIVHDTAHRVFEADPVAAEVEVWSRAGVLLGRARRQSEPPPRVAIDPTLVEPHARRHRGPDLSRHPMREEYGEPTPRGDVAPTARLYEEGGDTDGAAATFAEKLDLPPAVSARLGEDRDAAEVIRAILEAAGHDVEHRDGLLIAGGVVLCVLQPGPANVIGLDQLSSAFLRLSEVHAGRGLVVCPGVVDVEDLRRRELLAPSVRHIGPEDVQRMADAVALGGDPLGFAVGPDLRLLGPGAA